MPSDPPAELRASGAALWAALHADYDLSQAEIRLLIEACRTADLLDALAADIAVRGVVDEEGKVLPAVVEARQQRVTLTRLVASLRIPDGDDESRPQRRGAARGAYGVRQ